MNKTLKRIVALFLVALLCLPVFVLAETPSAEASAETSVAEAPAADASAEAPTEGASADIESVFTQLNWADYEAAIKEAGIDASFVTFDEIDVKIWMPAIFQAVELTDEDRENYIIGFYTDDLENASEGVMVILVPTEFGDVVDYANFVVEQGGTELEFAMINNIPALAYSLQDKDALYIAMVSTTGHVLEFSFWPVSDEGVLAVYQIMLASIQEVE